MSESLGHEVHLAGAEAPWAVQHPKTPETQAAADQVVEFSTDETATLSPEVSSLIKRCLDGTEPTDRPLKPWEQDKFSSRHVNMAMLRAAGFKVGEIAGAMGATIAMVSWTLSHPYGRKIIHALMTAKGARILDIRTKLEQFADEALEHVFSLTMESRDLDAVTKVGFGLLDRAGHGPTSKVEQIRPVATGGESSVVLGRLAEALEQSHTVNVAIMPVYVPKAPPEDQSRDTVGSQVQPEKVVFSGESSPGLAGGSGHPGGSKTELGIRLAKVSGG